MNRLIRKIAMFGSLLFAIFPCLANATVWIRVDNVANLMYQTQGTMVYLRNLSQYDSNALGCCYNY
jgi:hypothetical protein